MSKYAMQCPRTDFAIRDKCCNLGHCVSEEILGKPKYNILNIHTARQEPQLKVCHQKIQNLNRSSDPNRH